MEFLLSKEGKWKHSSALSNTYNLIHSEITVSKKKKPNGYIKFQGRPGLCRKNRSENPENYILTESIFDSSVTRDT